ncbi:MAG: histidine kinase [Bacteroidota bacterium]|nr:histidine kinase [Bacteroidota bacterium]
MRTKLLLIFSIALFISDIFAQNLPFEHINESKGLGQNNILSLHQGPSGFIWVGTQFGLLRYDGHEFEKIIELEGSGEDATILSISSNHNTLAALGQRRIFLVDKNTLSYQSVAFPPNKIIKPNKIIILRNTLVISAEDGLWSFKLGGNYFENIHPKSPITDIQSIATGKVIYSNSEGFWAYYPFTKKRVPIKYFPSSFIKHFGLNQHQEIYWLEGNNEFYIGHLKQNKISGIKQIELKLNDASTSVQVYQNNYYLGTKKGLLQINPSGETRLINQKEEQANSLSQNSVSCMLVDGVNNFWVGTEKGGINLHNPQRYKFSSISFLDGSKFSKCKEILSFTETENGEILFQNSLGNMGLFNPQSKEIEKWLTTDIIGNCMLAETNNPAQFLIGTPKGLYSYSHPTGTVKFISTKDSIKNFESDIKCILPYKNGTYWMAGNDGLFLFHAECNKTIEFYGIANSNLGTDNIRNIQFINKNEMLISTSKGLYLFKLRQKQFELIRLSGKKNESMVSMATTDSEGNIWVGTAGNGIFILKKNGEKLIINSQLGLANPQIFTLLFNQDKSQCWVSTNKGISSIDAKTFAVKNYYIQDGLQGSEYTESASLLTKNGTIFMGGISGFNYFNPKQVIANPNACKIAIKGLRVFNQKLPYETFYNIPSSKNFISFEYTALNFNLSGTQSYYYMLEGIDTGFNEVGRRRFASFGQLAPGNYTFKVRVANENNEIGLNEASISFNVIPEIYQTGWFKITSSILLAAIIALIIYFRTQRALAEEKEKGIQSNMIALLELKALRAQMNPHFIFNSLNSIQYFVMNNEGKEAAKYLSKFAKLIRMILDISEQTFVSIHSKIEFLKLYVDLEALRLNNTFTSEFWVDPNLDQSILIPTLLIQPHVENAIWHGLQSKQGNKKLLVQFINFNEETVQVIVSDNGIGRQAAMDIKKQKISLHQSKGSKISEDRIHSLNKLFGTNPKIEIIDLYDENNLACGTKVIINVPIIHG